jgi:acetyl-CoA C-acetyltransferase
MESALRAELGQNLDENRDQLADMYERFADVAKANPNAWHREGMSAEAIRNPSAKNKMLAFPYTKFHNTQWNVDQAGALIFCSVAKARALGVPEEKWVFPLSSAESNVMINLSQRTELQGSPGAKLAGEAALAAAGLQIDDVDYLDMYSCFPSAVKVYARALGIELDRQLTVTGGMTFGGGPLNNYVLQSTCRMASLLRAKPKSIGLVSSVSGMLTKQAWGLWSTLANSKGFVSVDVSEEVQSGWPVLEVVPPTDGLATIAGYTVEYQGGLPKRLIAVCDLSNGKRTVAYSEQQCDLELA